MDIVVDRDPDSGTYVSVFRSGYEVSEHGYSVHTIDPGASGADHEWYENVVSNSDDAPEKVRDKIREIAGEYHDPDGECDECDPDQAEEEKKIRELTRARKADGRIFYQDQPVTVIDRYTHEPVEIGAELTRIGKGKRTPVIFRSVLFNEATGEHCAVAIVRETSPVSGAVTEYRMDFQYVGLAFLFEDGRIYDLVTKSYEICVGDEDFFHGLVRTDNQTGREVVLGYANHGAFDFTYTDTGEKGSSKDASRFGIELREWSVDIEIARNGR
jgi:hypothetical protein